MLATLPHHTSSWEEVQELMKRLEIFLKGWTAEKGALDCFLAFYHVDQSISKRFFGH